MNWIDKKIECSIIPEDQACHDNNDDDESGTDDNDRN